MAPTAVCDLTGTMMCVQCVAPDQAMACGGTTPTCGSDNACHACSKHDDCGSKVCLADGACAMMADVAYVDPVNGTGTACSQAAPCMTVANALATNRTYVKLTGTVDEAVDVHGGRVVTFLAAPNTQLTRTKDNGAVITVRDNATSLSIFDLTIHNGLNNPSSIGVLIPAGSGAPSLSLTRTSITNNAGGGISAVGATVTISQSAISGPTGVGISVSGGSLTVSRSEIHDNNGGGIQMIADGMVTLTNNFIHHNVTDVSGTFGGMSLRPMPGSKVQFNTIVDNHAGLGAASAGGMFCDISGFVADDNIIFRNTGGASGMVQTFGNCSNGSSFVMAAGPTDNTPQFKQPNTPPLDYRLTGNTPMTIRDAAGSCSVVDYDGYQRPYGTACDLGASEYHP
jgi:hypothetical protein